MKRIFCRMLIALMIWTPYQMAQAGMIGTEQTASAASQTDRAGLLSMLGRADVSRQLQAFGIDPKQAQERVQAMSDQEITALAQRIDSLPAGGISDGGAVLLVILIVAGIWWWMSSGRR